MNTRMNNGEHFRLLDVREFHLCGRVDTKRVGRVLMDDGLLIASHPTESPIPECAVRLPTIPAFGRRTSPHKWSVQSSRYRPASIVPR